MKTREEIIQSCELFGIKEYTINDDMSIDVDTHVDLRGGLYKKIPLKFNKVWGHFLCNEGKLTSLENCPNFVGGNFKCQSNDLTSLVGGPEKVEGEFDCSDNELTNLIGSPKYVGRWFRCGPNDSLISLEGSPEYVGGNFICSDTNITSLSGSPKKVGYSIKCTWTEVLEFGDFDCEFKGILDLFSSPLNYLFGSLDIQNDVAKTFISFKILKGTDVNLKRLKYFYSIYDAGLTENDIVRINAYYNII